MHVSSQVRVKESSEIGKIAAHFIGKWDCLNHANIMVAEAPPAPVHQDPSASASASAPAPASAFDMGALAASAAEGDALDKLWFTLRELAYCYLTRPFPKEGIGAAAGDGFSWWVECLCAYVGVHAQAYIRPYV
jgi:hypothetical protein